MPYNVSINCKNCTTFFAPNKPRKGGNFKAGRTINGEVVSNKRVQPGFSPASRRRIQSYLLNWLSSIESVRFESAKRLLYKNYITFITLTLPSKQIHTDRRMKRVLALFLEKIRRYHDLGHTYIWVCEKQRNGNVHFHLVLDGFYDKSKLQADWNAHLPAEYIDNFESLYGHRNPPSTRVDSLKKGLARYLTKDFIKTVQKEGIDGKLWGCSTNLSKSKPFHDLASSRYEFLDLLEQSKGYCRFDPEVDQDGKTYYSVQFVKGKSPLDPCFIHNADVREYYTGMFAHLYPTRPLAL